MARKERLFIPGAPQLIQLKGHNHGAIFIDHEDYQHFLNCMDKGLNRYGGQLHGYCLLNNQLLLLLTPKNKINLGRFIQHIGRCYVPYFNKKFNRRGSLWEGRYNSCSIEPGSYFLFCQQYVDCYARLEGNCSQEDHPWSSYHHNTAQHHLSRITPHKEYEQMGVTPNKSAQEYRRFIQTPISTAVIQRIQACLNQNCVIGTPKYCQQIEMQIRRHVRPRQCGRPRKHYHNHANDWVWLEQKARELLNRYSYQEIRLPLLEHSSLDQYSDNFTMGKTTIACTNHNALLRNDGTLSCLRAIAQHKQLQQASKLWYQGQMFSGSDDQVRSFKQFHQIGVEAYGYEGSEIVLEQILLQQDYFNSLNLTKHLELKINHLGTRDEFNCFRKGLTQYLSPFRVVLDEQCQAWLDTTPEKIILTHPPLLDALIEKAPRLENYLSEESKSIIKNLKVALQKIGIPFNYQTSLYPERNYCQTIFEWHADRLDTDSLVCRGGRYDVCASQQLKTQTFACGFAFMLDPIVKLIQLTHTQSWNQHSLNMVIIPRTLNDQPYAVNVSRQLRQVFPDSGVLHDCSQVQLEKSKKNAFKNGSRFVLVVRHAEQRQIELYDEVKGRHQELTLPDTIQQIIQSNYV